jgi:DMSO/TMAO reductase YedYZ molybdopterin-dependent catalytic subunit
MPWTTVNATLYCVGATSTVIAGGNWTGVSLASILQRANVSTTAIKIAFYATDDYSTDLSLATGMQNDIIVAFENNGVPLMGGLRLVAPGLWGYKWIYQLFDIDLVDYNFLGTSESLGYSDSGLIA